MNVTKIYELRTLGYDKMVNEIERLNKEFRNLAEAKKIATLAQLTTDDPAKIKALQSSVKDYTVAIGKNRIEHGSWVQQMNAVLKARQLDILAQKEQIAQNKALTSAENAEDGSLNDLINKLKLLQALRKNTNPGNTVSFGGQNLNFQQAQAQAQALNNQIGILTQNMAVTGQVGGQTNNLLSQGFQSLKGHLGQMIIMYTGWFAAFREVGNIIQSNIKLSDSFADLEIRIKGSRDEVDALFESIKKIDTRTSIVQLVDIANIIAKKGVPTSEIAALTEEFDKLNVVLGTEIGEPSTATANIIKLITIFNDDKKVTAERVREIGTELFKLTTTGVATGEFLVNFAERVGAVRGITGLTLPNIFGMGAALQQLGQRVEVSSTAIVQFATRLFVDVPKYAKAAGVEVEAFRDILKDNPLEALVQVAQGLAQLTDEELHVNFEEVVQDFQAVGVVGVRVKAVLGDIATNGAFVRDRMKEATVTSADLARQTEAVELKQKTFAATLQRVRKELEQIGTSKAVQVTLAAIASIILVVASNLGIIVGVLGVYAATWAIANSAMIATRIATIASNVAFTAQYAILVVSNTITRVYAATITALTFGFRSATVATTNWGIALRALSLVGLAAAITAVVGLIIFFISKLRGSTQALSDHAIKQQAVLEIQRKATTAIAEQISKIDSWILVLKSANASLETKQLATQKLIDIDSRFNGILDGQIIKLDLLDKAYKSVTASIYANAQAAAAGTLAAEKQQKVLEISATRQRLEIEFAQQTGPVRKITGLTKTEESIISDLANVKTLGNGRFTALAKDVPRIIELLKAEEAKANNTYLIYLREKAYFDTLALNSQDKIEKEQRDKLIEKSANEPLTISELEALIKNVDKELGLLREGDPKIAELHRSRLNFENRLKALKGIQDRTRPYFGARVGGQEKDALADIEANLRLALAERERQFADLQIETINGVKQIRRVSYDEEVKYTTDIRDINQNFTQQKINYLEGLNSLNVKEKETLAGFKKNMVDIELKYLKDIQGINDREFDDRRIKLKNQLTLDIDEARAVQRLVERDPLATNTQKTQAKLEADQKILDLQVTFNNAINELEKQFNQRTTTNAKEGAEAVRKIKEDLYDDLENLEKANKIDQDNILERDLAGIDSKYQRLRLKIINNDKLTVTERANALDKLDKLYKYTILTRELERLTLEFQRVKTLYDQGLVTEREYLQAKAEMEKKATDAGEANQNLKKVDILLPSGGTTQQSIKEQLAKLFGFADGSAEFQLLGEVISQTFDLATQAMNNYFDAEEQRIRDSLEIHLQRLDIEKEQVKARAQSQAEIDSIEKQYAAKRLKAQREAGEEVKRIKRSEAKIALATELANIAVSAASNPLNGVTFGASGAIMYAILSALAFGRYALNISNINREKFESGGWISRGGMIKGPSHAHGGVPFNYEAEGGELGIVRTKGANPLSRYTISGNQMEIASMLNKIGGGTHFKSGAKLHRFETGGLLGSNYKAPFFIPSSGNGIDLESLVLETRAYIIATNNRIDKLHVVQDTDTVTDAQTKKVKQNNIGVL